MTYDEDAYRKFTLADHSLDEITHFLDHYEMTEENWDDVISEEEDGANRPEVIDWFNAQRA